MEIGHLAYRCFRFEANRMAMTANAVRTRPRPVKNKTFDDTLSVNRSMASPVECVPFKINIIPTARANQATACTAVLLDSVIIVHL